MNKNQLDFIKNVLNFGWILMNRTSKYFISGKMRHYNDILKTNDCTQLSKS